VKQYLFPQGGRFYKVNMHCHTTCSDGEQTPEEVKAHYLANGYAAVAFTEHEGLLDFSYLTDENFVAINAYEYDFMNEEGVPFRFYEGAPRSFEHLEQVHLNLYAKDPQNLKMVCYNPDQLQEVNIGDYKDRFAYHGSDDFVRSYTLECFNQVIREARANGFLVIYNHPTWSLNTYPLYAGLVGLDGLEIVNGTHKRSDLDYVPQVYDQMSRAGQRLICVGGDDNHRVSGSCYAWTMVHAEKLTYEGLIKGLEKGNCYASTGPEIHALYIEDGAVHVQCSPARGIYYTTAGRRKAYRLAERGEPLVTEAVFLIDPDDISFRITVRDAEGEHANTRIYYLDELKT